MTVKDPEDATALLAASGDLAAVREVFSTFYRAQMPGLVTFLRWQGATLPEAADLAQDAMVKAFARWGTLTNPKAWIRTVASRGLIRSRLACLEDPVDAVPEPTALVNAPADLTEVEEHHKVLTLLDLLPPRQRQVLAWTLDGYKPAEIAADLGITPEAVRGSLMKARRTLAEHMGPGKDQQS